MPPVATVTVAQKNYYLFAVSLNDGSNFNFEQFADTEAAAISKMSGELQAMLTAIQAIVPTPHNEKSPHQ